MTPKSVASHERRDHERQETREKILDAARQMFARDGYEAVTMRAIAEHIKYTATALYHHFDSKQSLVTELCTCDFASLGQRFRQAGGIADPVERIRASGLAYIEFAHANPNHYRYMFMTVLPAMDPATVHAGKLGNPEHDAYAFMRQTCQEAIDQGRIRPEYTDADELAQLLWSSLHGLISLRIVKAQDTGGAPAYLGVPWRDANATARHLIDVMIRGIVREAHA